MRLNPQSPGNFIFCPVEVFRNTYQKISSTGHLQGTAQDILRGSYFEIISTFN